MKSLVWTLCFVVALNSLGIAQATNPPSQKKPAKPISKPEVTELPLQQQRAIAVLESLVKETIAIDDQPLRIKTQAKIADALWSYNQARAREIFTEAFQATESVGGTSAESDARSLVAKGLLGASFSERAKLRQEVLTLMALHDTKLAEQLRASAAVKKEEQTVDAETDRKAKMIEQLAVARSLVRLDPQKAAQVVRQIFQSGFHPDVAFVLRDMRFVNQGLADALFKEALSAARQVQGSLAASGGSLTFYFWEEGGSISFADPARVRLLQSFLDLAYEVIARQVAIESEGTLLLEPQQASKDVSTLQLILPWFARLMPDAVPTVRIRIAQLTKYLSNEQVNATQREPEKPVDYKDLLKDAEAAHDPRQKDRLYARAAGEAAQQGKHEEAIRLIEKIQDRQFRELQGAVTRFGIARRAIAKGDFEEAHRYAKEIEFSPQRVRIYQMLSDQFIGKKDYPRATTLLMEIQHWLEASPEDPKKAQGLLEVTALVASFDPPRGFEVAKLAAQAINNADFKTPPNKMEVQIKVEYLDFARPFAPLARADFERALLIAQSMQKKEAAVLAQVEICKAVLIGAQSKKP